MEFSVNKRIEEIGIVPVIKLTNPERDAAPFAKALVLGGVPVAEVTFRAKGAEKAIAIMKETCPDMSVPASCFGRSKLTKPWRQVQVLL